MKVRELMTKEPICCTPDTNLQRVAQLMVEHDCGALPIVDSEDERRPLGVVTDRDIATRVVAKGKNPLETRVQDAMTASTVTVKPDAKLEDAARLMRDNQLRRLIVVDDDGSCAGLVSLADIARRAEAEDAGTVLRDVTEPSERASEAVVH